MTVVEAPDLRAALKARHRAAILDAARALVADAGGPEFGVDELAARAGIARRTVFNHFASLDEVLLTLCDESLDVLIDDFIAAVAASPTRNGGLASMFDELANTLRDTDLPAAIVRVSTILGGHTSDDSRKRILSDSAFSRASTRLLQAVTRRYPDVDALDAELLISSMMSGVIVISEHWSLSHQLRLDADSRAEWHRLVTRLIHNVRAGYLPER